MRKTRRRSQVALDRVQMQCRVMVRDLEGESAWQTRVLEVGASGKHVTETDKVATSLRTQNPIHHQPKS
jgi:hypothetical protein